MLCLRDLKKIIMSVADLTQVATKFQAVTDRNIDRIMFPLHEFARSFRERPGNSAALQGVTEAQLAWLESAKLKELNDSTMHEYREAFHAMGTEGVPVDFLLANQLLAVQLVSRVIPAKDVLVRLGTGQGKSIVLALSAIAECDAGRDKVFVFTSYDHLAERDHAFASRLFKVKRLTSCVVTSNPDSLRDFAGAKVVFANIMAIDELSRTIFKKLYTGEPVAQSEEAFLSLMYGVGPQPSFSVLLDEYDLLLQDMEGKQPFLMRLPPATLTLDDVKRFSKFGPVNLQHERPSVFTSTPAVDAAAGTTHVTVSGRYFQGETGPFYMPLACVFRLGQFMARAKRVVGASGSTTAGGGPLPGREQAPVPSFFEMPWSQDPKLFETRIVPDGFTSPSKLSDGSPAQLAGGSGIWCHRREIIPCALNQDEALLVTSDQVERYCQAIRADISSIQAPRTDESGAAVPVRPVLVFVPELLAYVDGKGRRRAVRDRLSEVILELVGNDFRVDMPRGEDPTETEIQRIGQPGFVTLAGIMLGRGIDIRVSVSIPGGLHVLVGAEVVHERLLKQMIGRTGRLGREGSYSIISLGRILSPSKPVSSEPYLGALHLASALGAHVLLGPPRLTGDERRVWVCKWLLFFMSCSADSSRGARCINAGNLKELIPESATSSSPGATDVRARLQGMLGVGEPL